MADTERPTRKVRIIIEMINPNHPNRHKDEGQEHVRIVGEDATREELERFAHLMATGEGDPAPIDYWPDLYGRRRPSADPGTGMSEDGLRDATTIFLPDEIWWRVEEE